MNEKQVLKKERFVEKAKKIHNNKYDYSKVDYVNCKIKVCIVCPEHGEFWQTPDNHLQGRGCPVCRYISSGRNNSLTQEEFIKRAKEIHGDRYDYSKVNYINNRTKVCIICSEHGEFWQEPTTHLDNKAGCPKCSKNYRYTTEEFLSSLPEWIKERYDFSKFVYKRTHEKSTVICSEHGEFLMSPHNIRKGIGCPGCSESKIEREIRLFLKKNNIRYFSEYKHTKEFCKQALDFYLPDYNIGIECQGIQHFEPTDFAGKGIEWAKDEYKNNIELDINKQNLCKKNNIKLIYFTTVEHKKLITENKNTHFKGYNVFTCIEDIEKILESVSFDEN